MERVWANGRDPDVRVNENGDGSNLARARHVAKRKDLPIMYICTEHLLDNPANQPNISEGS